MAGVFNRGRAGSGEVWHTPSNLARHADKVRVTPRRTPLARLPASSPLPSPPPSSAHIAPALPPQSSVPLRECLADAFAASARDEHENVDPMEDVDLDEIELVYDTLAKSERIVRGYTEFGFEDKGVRRAYRTSNPTPSKNQTPDQPSVDPTATPYSARKASSSRASASVRGEGAEEETSSTPSRERRASLPRPRACARPNPRSTDPSRGEDPEACSRPRDPPRRRGRTRGRIPGRSSGLGIGLRADRCSPVVEPDRRL